MIELEFKVASKPEDYEACYDLMVEQDLPRVELKLPTMMAFKDGKLIGFLGTHTQDDMVIGGPLVMKDSSVHTAYTLCELYEVAMRSLGVKSYIMHVDDGNFMDQAIKRYNPPNLEQYAREGTRTFYIRRL